MATVGIELVDAALVAARDGEVVAASPGIALLEPAGLLVGEEAAAAAWLKPVLAVDRFWSELSVEPLPRATPRALSHADLAHAHLESLWRQAGGEAAVLAVPGSVRLQQLGLALGIAASAGIRVTGAVDAAVAACAGLAARELVLHLDVQLHQAVLTAMGGTRALRRRRVELASRAGLKAIHAAWAQLVSEAMVRRTRFDPLHQASTEQQLHEKLPGWLAALAADGAVDATISSGTGTFTASLRREQFVLAAEAWYTQLIELVQAGLGSGEAATLALSARAASLPGLRERLAASRELEVVVLPEAAAATGAAARADEAAFGDEPALLTALSRRHPVEARRRAVGAPRGPAPTHLVLDGRAHAIKAEPLVVGAGPGEGRRLELPERAAGVSRRHCSLLLEDGGAVVRDHSRHGCFLNGERIEGEAPLAVGDRLRLGSPGIVLELVAVG